MRDVGNSNPKMIKEQQQQDLITVEVKEIHVEKRKNPEKEIPLVIMMYGN